jgi:hypothetical protein
LAQQVFGAVVGEQSVELSKPYHRGSLILFDHIMYASFIGLFMDSSKPLVRGFIAFIPFYWTMVSSTANLMLLYLSDTLLLTSSTY